MISFSRMRRAAIAASVTLALVLSASGADARSNPQPAGRTLSPQTRFYVPLPVTGAIKQIVKLVAHGQFGDAKLITGMVTTPQAVWFDGGTPKDVKRNVRTTVTVAAALGTVPVLVAYDIPGRDCAQYSAGGAATGDAYKAWIDAFTAGLDRAKAVVILEPDGLALLPTDCGQLDTYGRVGLINYAAHALLADPNASIYLDAGHSAWHNVTDMASRLVQGGVQDVSGFYLNPSNYQYTANLIQYGTWISDCITYATVLNRGNYGACPDEFWNGGPHPAKIADLLGAEWKGVALSPYGQWSDTTNTPELNTSGENVRYGNMLGTTAATTHFVIDTSRNGVGPWPGIAGHPASAAATQDWCNPPGRGLGLRPMANTGVPLLDAYLWIKIPGASDGACYRWTSGPTDPVRSMVDPAAGAWFPEMALELARNAVPPLGH